MVKIYCFVFLLAVIQASSANELKPSLRDELQKSFYGGFAEKFANMLERMKTWMKKGNPNLRIPVLDPLDQKQIELHFEREKLITVDGNLENVYAEGLSNYNVKSSDFSLPKKNFSLALFWPRVKGKFSYDIDAMLAEKIPIYGKGNISFDIEGFYFTTKAKFVMEKQYVTIDHFFDTKISVKKSKINLTGLYNDEEISKFTSEVISDMLPDILVEYQPEVTEEINNLLKESINEFLKDVTLGEIISY